MSQYIEFQGKNVDLALKEAGKKLNKPVDRIRYEVVSYGSSGIFGLVGAKKAKIRIKSDDAYGTEFDTKAQARNLVKDAFQIKEEGGPKKSKKPEPAKRNNFKEQDSVKRSEPSAEGVEEAVAIGRKALQRFVDFITSDAVINVSASPERIIFKVESDNSGLLIGKRGQTLEAMQYLVEKIVNKQGKERCRVLVDVEGYLKTRKANLEKMATSMAEKAQKTQKPVTIGQMNAYDRRTVHIHLKRNPKVRTQSVGEGYYRKLIIFPKKRRRKRSRN